MATNNKSNAVKSNQYWRRNPFPPDVLYHASTEEKVQQLRAHGVLEHPRGKSVYLSRTEGHAWQVAHRLNGTPIVLVIDVPRARKNGTRFFRNRHGLWEAPRLLFENVLNLQEHFAEQVSAGGIPCFFGEDGPRIALIQVQRAKSLTWEVTKGKLELGETPQQAAIREIGEEMGCQMPLQVFESLGRIRFGFFTPEREPRLKTLHLFLMKTDQMYSDFSPAYNEGIMQVKWFHLDEAVKLIAHRSLKPIFRKVYRILKPFDQ